MIQKSIYFLYFGVSSCVFAPSTFPGFRLLRSVKNRFGPANEIGVFQMTSFGLEDVADPSMLFLSTRHADGDGSGDEATEVGMYE